MSSKSSHNGAAPFSFGNVARHEVQTDRIGEYAVSEIELYSKDEPSKPRTPVLYGVCAGEKNKKLRAAVNKANARRSRRKSSNAQILAAARANCRAFFPTCVLTDWQDVYDDSGEAVPFSVEAAGAFLEALPDWILQGVMEYFGDPANFSGDEEEELTQEDVLEAAGN